MKFEIFKYEVVTSTNDIAIDLIKEKKKETGFICSSEQNKGRGTKGKEWVSEKGNFFGSIFFPLANAYPPFNEFSIINPVIISNVIKNFCVNEKITFKWPNDVLLNERKISGILQELITFNSKQFLIVGIGINIISNPNINAEYKATNIYSETGKKITTKEIMDMVISSYEDFFINLNSYSYISFKKKADLMVSKYKTYT